MSETLLLTGTLHGRVGCSAAKSATTDIIDAARQTTGLVLRHLDAVRRGIGNSRRYHPLGIVGVILNGRVLAPNNAKGLYENYRIKASASPPDRGSISTRL